jgi:hypothetical protein
MQDTREPARQTESQSHQAPTWQAPTFVEVKMDAEIGSYQTDFDYDGDGR